MAKINGTIRSAESAAIIEALNQSQGNHTRAAKILGISREGLRGKIKRLKLKLRAFYKPE
jgi:DNA-binding NtrC family response regulator